MSKTKQWAWEEAEKALDELIAKVKSGETVSTVLEYAKTLQIHLYHLSYLQLVCN